MDCYILHIDLLVNISLFLIVAISYHYGKHKKKYYCTRNIDMENNEF